MSSTATATLFYLVSSFTCFFHVRCWSNKTPKSQIDFSIVFVFHVIDYIFQQAKRDIVFLILGLLKNKYFIFSTFKDKFIAVNQSLMFTSCKEMFNVNSTLVLFGSFQEVNFNSIYFPIILIFHFIIQKKGIVKIPRRLISEILKRAILQVPCRRKSVVESVFNKIAGIHSRSANLLNTTFH